MLLLDEPTTRWTSDGNRTCSSWSTAARGARAHVLGAIHDLTLAGQYADRLVLLDGGRVVAAAPRAPCSPRSG